MVLFPFVPTWRLVFLMQFLLRTTVPGVARRLLTFFASPKKVSKERRPRDPGPSGCPVLRCKKWEGKKLASLKHFSFSFHFLHRSTGWLQAELPRLLAFGIAVSDVQRCLLGRRPSERWDPVTSVPRSTVFTTLGSNFRWNDKTKETT